MKYFKRIDTRSSGYETGKIYPEDAKPIHNTWLTIKECLKTYPDRWKEVSEIEYIKQQGWYIKGSDKFRDWLRTNLKKENVRNYLGTVDWFKYSLDDKNTFDVIDDTKDKIEVTIDQLNEIYNIKPKKKEMEFKIGDEVLVTSWHYTHIKFPQKGIITRVMNDYYRVKIEEDHHGESKVWAFSPEELKPINKQKEMENFEVKVNEVTSKILQELAFENGWSIGTQAKEQILDSSYLIFNINRRTISYAGGAGCKQVSLEEAINRITTKEESFKEGDWLIGYNGIAKFIFKYTGEQYPDSGSYRCSAWICLNYGKEDVAVGSQSSFNTDGSISKVERKATDKEVESALIEEGKRRGFVKGARFKQYKHHHGSIIISDSYKYSDNNLIVSTDEGKLWIYSPSKSTGSFGDWAKIVDEPKEIFGFKVTEEGAHYPEDHTFKFGCSDHVYTKSELERVASTLGEIAGRHTVQELYSELMDLIDE